MIELSALYTILFVVVCILASFFFGWYLKKSYKYGIIVAVGTFAYFLISSIAVFVGYQYFSQPINFVIWEMDIFGVLFYLIAVLAFDNRINDLYILLGFAVVMLFLFPANILIASTLALACSILAIVIHFVLKSRFS